MTDVANKPKCWPMPKNAHFSHYCCHCRHWEFVANIGCAHVGVCRAIKDEPTEQDAYDKPCGLWEKRDNERSVTHDHR